MSDLTADGNKLTRLTVTKLLGGFGYFMVVYLTVFNPR